MYCIIQTVHYNNSASHQHHTQPVTLQTSNQQIYNRIQNNKTVDTILCIENTQQDYNDNKFLYPVKSTFLHNQQDAKDYSLAITSLADTARSLVRDIDPYNDVQLIRIQTTNNVEIVSTVDQHFRLIVVQDTEHSNNSNNNNVNNPVIGSALAGKRV